MSRQHQLQRRRLWFQSGFFLLFVLAPPLDLFRYDLTRGHFYLLGMEWRLGIEPFMHGEIGASEVVVNLLLRGFVPLVLVAGIFIAIAWRYGRLYCGWLCPHFSVVEMINKLMVKAGGKPSVWERAPLPLLQADGSLRTSSRLYWPVTWLAAAFFAFLWATILLTYLLPPAEIYHNLLHNSLTANQLRFIVIGSALFFIEFMFARHLFCRFGCAIGLFQSLAWMANRKAMVVDFDKPHARRCSDCNNACDNACPMRLKPRTLKRSMFTCTQCAQCISACTQVQARQQAITLLRWRDGESEIRRSESSTTRTSPDGEEVKG
ncbi:MAG TPA: 4Fe-4S binding protein [Gammaproteobacteria bacterium]